MCMSARPANFSVTKVYAGEGEYKNKYVHVVAYQNNADSQNMHEPNAMILPFPAAAAMNESNVIDTRKFKSFLKNIATASEMRGKTLGGTRRGMIAKGGVAFNSDALVFDVGSYTVILAEDAIQIPDALEKVSEDKRPNLSWQLLTGLSKLYPDQPLAVCCWSGSVKAEPLLWWYEPKDKSTLFWPTMDAHDGGAPNPKAVVETDHIIMAGSSLKPISKYAQGNVVVYTDEIPKEVRTLLPNQAFGADLPSRMMNGDIFLKTEDVTFTKDGKFHVPIAKRGTSASDTHSEIHMYGWHN